MITADTAAPKEAATECPEGNDAPLVATSDPGGQHLLLGYPGHGEPRPHSASPSLVRT